MYIHTPRVCDYQRIKKYPTNLRNLPLVASEAWGAHMDTLKMIIPSIEHHIKGPRP